MAGFSSYTPPGVNVSESISPSISPLLASPADICLIGVPGNLNSTQTPLTVTDTVILAGTNAQLLPTIASLNNNAQLLSVLSVTNLIFPTPAAYVANTDYTVQVGQGPPNGANGTITRIATPSDTPAGTGSIPSGTVVAVTYTYVPVDYWDPIRLFDIASIEARFGASWATTQSQITGQNYYSGINSQLSMAARIAFENGAQSVICQPLFTLDGGGNQIAPTAGNVGNSGTWSNTLLNLRAIVDLNIIVPIVGQDNVNVTDSGMLSIFTAVQSHLAYMNTQQQYIVAIFGEDGTIEGVGNNTSGLMSVMRGTHAPSLAGNFSINKLAQQCVLINNTVYQRAVPGGSNATISLGGQYAAAAVAGGLGGRPVSSSLTRKPVLGFQSITDPRTPADKNADAGSGMFVIEQVGNLIRCRQALTIDTIDGPEFSELSVVRSKFLMIESIRTTLDNQIIGNIIADANSPIIVRSAISSVLSVLQQAGVIVGYTQVNAALTSLNPTTISASFSYQAAFPVNYVNVTFSLDLTSGAITSQVGGSGATG